MFYLLLKIKSKKKILDKTLQLALVSIYVTFKYCFTVWFLMNWRTARVFQRWHNVSQEKSKFIKRSFAKGNITFVIFHS